MGASRGLALESRVRLRVPLYGYSYPCLTWVDDTPMNGALKGTLPSAEDPYVSPQNNPLNDNTTDPGTTEHLHPVLSGACSAQHFVAFIGGWAGLRTQDKLIWKSLAVSLM